MRPIFTVLMITFFLFNSCAASKGGECSLTKINIIDRNGLSQTYSNRERINQYRATNFTDPQPYKKVMRVFERDAQGDVPAIITTYHPNGELKQYLEILNGRAFGIYSEWFPNSEKKLEVKVIGGEADLDEKAKLTWLFDGVSRAWDDDGTLAAEIPYSRGVLTGEALYYHRNGAVWKRTHYREGLIEGVHEIYLDSGALLQRSAFHQGALHGASTRYWSESAVAAVEQYERGSLITASYFRKDGEKIGEVIKGSGVQARFGKESIAELVEYRDGEPEGAVKLFGEDEKLVRLYHIKNGQKHGVHIEFYHDSIAQGEEGRRKMEIEWSEGKIQGTVKTWYPNGQLESQKEMSCNRRSGLSTSWYEDGSLMMVEEYNDNKLLHGKYMKRGESHPFSKVYNGNGEVALFDGGGSLIRKTDYRDGYPVSR